MNEQSGYLILLMDKDCSTCNFHQHKLDIYLREEVMFSLRFVCPSVRVRPSVCVQDNSKTTGRIFLKFGRHVGIVKSKRWHDFGDDPEWTMESGSVIPNLHIFNVPYFKA